MRLPEQPSSETIIEAVTDKFEFISGRDHALPQPDAGVVDRRADGDGKSGMNFPGNDRINAGVEQPAFDAKGSEGGIVRPLNPQAKGSIHAQTKGEMALLGRHRRVKLRHRLD